MRRADNSYKSIINFGCNTSPANNPLTYCVFNNELDNLFLHGSSASGLVPSSNECQLFMSDYCAQGWDTFCEAASLSQDARYGNTMDTTAPLGLTQGDQLIRNTAARKFRVGTFGNCGQKCKPFNPNVASSVQVCYYECSTEGCGDCVPIYSVDPETIDKDVVMNKVLDNPYIAQDILLNIFNTMNRTGTFQKLQGTRLAEYFASNNFHNHRLNR